MGKLKVVSRSSQPFADREEAGHLLTRELDPLRGRDVVVLGIPRGGIIAARELAQALEGHLDVILSHKLRTPGRPEVAMGAVAEGGIAFVDPEIVRLLGISVNQIEEEKAFQTDQLNRWAEQIRRIRPKVPLKGHTVVITD
ncbi:MAG: phosphoribosyltransferase, partial [Desulfobacterota bacterium]|nr:phosphoribosyltransferase [Thermodesulfobacteriota bacterium]